MGDSFVWRAAVGIGALAPLAGLAMLVDSREITGVNAWLKPLKFALSVAIYLATVHVLLGWLEAPAGRKALIGNGIAITMIVEMVCIVLQAWRGERSHFNFSTPFNGAVFGLMGLFIAANTLLLVWLAVEFFRTQAGLGPGLVWGIRLGLLSALIGSALGGVIIGNQAHTVGAPDGGPGLPFLNWSTLAGDLRIAHAIGLHGLQLLPLLGWWLDRERVPRAPLLVAILFVAITALSAVTLLQALSGKPLVAAVSPPGAARSKAAV